MAAPALPLYLLLDTNALYPLTSEHFINEHLDRLQEAAAAGFIRVLMPEVLAEEWKKHKAIRLQEIEKLTKDSSRLSATLSRVSRGKAVISDAEFAQIKQLLVSRIDAVETLFQQYADTIPRTPEMPSKLYRLRQEGKAPFHKNDNKDHIDDAELMYYSIDYLLQLSADRFFFVSNNSGEFSISKNEKDKGTLHPDYQAYCPDLTIHFAPELGELLIEMERWGLPVEVREPARDSDKVYEDIEIDRNLSVIQQTLHYLQSRIAIWRHWPKLLLTEHYPFLVSL